MMKPLNIDYDFNRMVEEYISMGIQDKLIENNYQMATQKIPDTPVDIETKMGTGSLLYDWERFDPDIHTQPPMRKKFLKQNDFTELCSYLEGTYTGEVINDLKERYSIVRGRYILSEPHTCLGLHTDSSQRIHIPLVTSDRCFMTIDDFVIRLPYGNVFKVDTTRTHTAVNASEEYRAHLVFCLPN